MNLKTKQSLSVILAVVSGIGTIATAFLARKAALKESQYAVQGIDISNKPFKEQLKILAPIYIPTIVSGALTISSIIGSSVMSHKAQASIMSMAVLADQGWRRYKHQVKRTLGLEGHEGILKEVAKSRIEPIKDSLGVNYDKDVELYYEELTGYFKAKPEDVALAYAEINEILNTSYRNQLNNTFDGVTIGHFLKLANAELIDKSVNITNLDFWGWTMDYLSDQFNGDIWVNMYISREKTDDGVVPFNVISWKQEPIFFDEDSMTAEQLSLEGFNVGELD